MWIKKKNRSDIDLDNQNSKVFSSVYCRKYIGEHYPDLDVEGGGFRKAIEGGEARGQLKRISGKE